MTEPGVTPTFENLVRADNPTKKAENGLTESQSGGKQKDKLSSNK